MSFHTIEDYGNYVVRRIGTLKAGEFIPLRAEVIKEEARDSTGDFSVYCKYFDGKYEFRHQTSSGYSRGEEVEPRQLERGLLALVEKIRPHIIRVSRLGEHDRATEGRIERVSEVDYAETKDLDAPRLIIENPEVLHSETATSPPDSTPVQMVFEL